VVIWVEFGSNLLTQAAVTLGFALNLARIWPKSLGNAAWSNKSSPTLSIVIIPISRPELTTGKE
jgi:hypothetical protein